MTPLHKAAQMALDALDAITDDVDGTGLNTMPSFDKALDAIAALREALNAPEPEPYGHVTTHTVTGQQFFYRYPSPPYLDTAKECIAVYAAPPAAPDHLRDIAEKVAPAAPLPDGLATNADEVICPNCAHQFRAIPENVQSLLLASGHEPPFTASPAAPVVPLPRPGPLGLIQYAGVDMLQYAAAVSAAKDEEMVGLRAELIKSLADNKALRERVRVLEDARPEPDCRTCKRSAIQHGVTRCTSPYFCTNADHYEPLPPVRLWRTT